MSDPKVVAAVLAGGTGNRVGSSVPKTLLQVLGHPLIHYSLRTLQAIPRIAAIRVAIHPLHAKTLERLLAPYPRKTYRGWVEGGATRPESALAALNAFKDEEPDVVLIHDAARPCITREEVEDLLDALADNDGAILTAPLVDTIWKTEESAITETMDRRNLQRALTPQAFPFETVLNACERGIDEGFQGTDDASFVRHYGGRVVHVPGSRWNLKVTYPEDLALVEAILSGGSGCA